MKNLQWKWLFGLILFIALVVVCQNVNATNHYIRPGAGGSNNGTDWTNAWIAQPGTWVRGDTYYYADGEIDEYIIMDVADSGTDRITLKKATAGDHGTETGWDSGYGDGTFHFTAITRIMLLWSSYVTIDGQTGGGPGSWKTGFGFKFSIPDSTNGDNFALIDCNRDDAVTNIIITHCEFKQAGYDNWEPVGDGYYNHQHCIDFLRVENTTVSYCYLHEANNSHLYMDDANGITIEYNYFEHVRGAPHGESISCNASGVSSGNIFRYNIFEDCAGTGIIVLKDSIQGEMYIYSNLFFTQDKIKFYITNGAICDTGGDTTTDIKCWNNTFYNLTSGTLGLISWRGASVTGNEAKNNLAHSCGEFRISGVNFVIDNNASEYVGIGDDSCEFDLDDNAANVFISVTEGSENFAPLFEFAGRNVGSDMSDEFLLDIRGNPYGADGKWDIGAYEEQTVIGAANNEFTGIKPFNGVNPFKNTQPFKNTKPFK